MHHFGSTGAFLFHVNKRKREELPCSKNNQKKQRLLHQQITSRFALELLLTVLRQAPREPVAVEPDKSAKAKIFSA